jgi:hypothetical protein
MVPFAGIKASSKHVEYMALMGAMPRHGTCTGPPPHNHYGSEYVVGPIMAHMENWIYSTSVARRILRKSQNGRTRNLTKWAALIFRVYGVSNSFLEGFAGDYDAIWQDFFDRKAESCCMDRTGHIYRIPCAGDAGCGVGPRWSY